MKRLALLAPVAAVFLIFFASCEKNDPDSLYDSASSSSVEDIEYALQSSSFTGSELAAITSSFTFDNYTRLSASSSLTGVHEGATTFEDLEGNAVTMNVIMTDFVDFPDEMFNYKVIGSSSYTTTQDELSMATQEMTNVTGHGAASIAGYPVSALTTSSSLTDAVNNYAYDVDLSNLDNVSNTSGWIYSNSTKHVAKIYLLIEGRFGMVIETHGSSNESDLVMTSVSIMQQLNQWIDDQSGE